MYYPYLIEEEGIVYYVSLDSNNNIMWKPNYYGRTLHREKGPAVISPNGDKQWWFHGKRVNCNSQEEFEKLLKLKAFW